MIDTELINEAEEKSKVIEAIDHSWRTFVNDLKEGIFAIPFKGTYQAFIEGDSLFVEGYCGLLLIDRLYYKHKTYLLKNPVKYHPFKIYGVYDNRGDFEHFAARPEIGFHYLGLSERGHAICTGDIQYSNPDSLEALKEAALKIASSFRLINLESLGTVLLPDDYASLRTILSNKEEDAETKFKKLRKEKLIEELL
jgi:hypothetical protein